ncbi:MAG: hypothetical protein L3J69_15415 [Desulfobacula sp.]|nr:hypothetical protein [Desulfobacula sp.]
MSYSGVSRRVGIRIKNIKKDKEFKQQFDRIKSLIKMCDPVHATSMVGLLKSTLPGLTIVPHLCYSYKNKMEVSYE